MAPLRRRAHAVVMVTSSCRLDPNVVKEPSPRQRGPEVVRLTSLEPEERGVGCLLYLGPRDGTQSGMDPKSLGEVASCRLDLQVVGDPSPGRRVLDVVRVPSQQSDSETQHDKTNDKNTTDVQSSRMPSDFLVLYYSLVRDGVLPPGFGEAFSDIGTPSKFCSRPARPSQPLVFPTCSRHVGSVTETNEPHS